MHARLDSDRRCCRLWARLLTNDNPSALSTISATSETHYSERSLSASRAAAAGKNRIFMHNKSARRCLFPEFILLRARPRLFHSAPHFLLVANSPFGRDVKMHFYVYGERSFLFLCIAALSADSLKWWMVVRALPPDSLRLCAIPLLYKVVVVLLAPVDGKSI